MSGARAMRCPWASGRCLTVGSEPGRLRSGDRTSVCPSVLASWSDAGPRAGAGPVPPGPRSLFRRSQLSQTGSLTRTCPPAPCCGPIGGTWTGSLGTAASARLLGVGRERSVPAPTSPPDHWERWAHEGERRPLIGPPSGLPLTCPPPWRIRPRGRPQGVPPGSPPGTRYEDGRCRPATRRSCPGRSGGRAA